MEEKIIINLSSSTEHFVKSNASAIFLDDGTEIYSLNVVLVKRKGELQYEIYTDYEDKKNKELCQQQNKGQ